MIDLTNGWKKHFPINEKIRDSICVDHFSSYIGKSMITGGTIYNEATDPNKCFHHNMDDYKLGDEIIKQFQDTLVEWNKSWNEQIDAAIVTYLMEKYDMSVEEISEGIVHWKKLVENTNNCKFKQFKKFSYLDLDNYTDNGDVFLSVNHRDHTISEVWRETQW